MQLTDTTPKSQDKSSREEILQIAAHIFDTFSYQQYHEDPKAGLSFSTSPSLDIQPAVHVEVFESLIRVRALNQSVIPHSPPTRTAGDIKQFSRNSRMRAFKWLKTLRTKVLSDAVFITLTYHNEKELTPLDHWQHLEKFLRWLRADVPGVVYIWRREYQKRGMVHFHFIVWSRTKAGQLYSPLLCSQVKNAWLNIKPCRCSDCQLYAVKLLPVTSKLHTSAYLNKYISKCSDLPATGTIGRFWGTSSDAPCEPNLELDLTICQRDLLKELVMKFLLSQKNLSGDFIDRLATLQSYTIFVEEETVAQWVTQIFDGSPPATALKLSPALNTQN